MRRTWFQDKDGTYYRNINLILADQKQALRQYRWWQLRQLEAEWDQAWREGLIRTDRIGPRDRVVTPLPFREAYPDKPILWTLDAYPRHHMA